MLTSSTSMHLDESDSRRLGNPKRFIPVGKCSSSSCANLIRASISLKRMDCRVKPGNDTTFSSSGAKHYRFLQRLPDPYAVIDRAHGVEFGGLFRTADDMRFDATSSQFIV